MKHILSIIIISICAASSYANTTGVGPADKMLSFEGQSFNGRSYQLGGSGAGPGQEAMNLQSGLFNNLRNSASAISPADRVIFMGKDQADIKYGTINDSGSVEVNTNRVEEISPDVTEALRKSRTSRTWEEVFKSGARSAAEMKRMINGDQ